MNVIDGAPREGSVRWMAIKEIAAENAAALRKAQNDGFRPTRHAATIARPTAARPTTRPATTTPTRQFSYADADAAVNAIAEGFYALPRTTPDAGDNMVTCFKVFDTRKGHMIRQIIGGGATGGFRELRLSVEHQVFAARHIAEAPKAAMVLFGRSTGTCGKCGRALTNEKSVAAGIGPECAKAF